MRRVHYIENFIQDLKYGLRMLAKNPGFAFTDNSRSPANEPIPCCEWRLDSNHTCECAKKPLSGLFMASLRKRC